MRNHSFTLWSLICMATLITGTVAYGQPIESEGKFLECGTVVGPEQLAYELNRMAKGLTLPLTAPQVCAYNIPLTLHIVRKSDGSLGLPDADALQAVFDLNTAYNPNGVFFAVVGSIDYIDDDDFMDGTWLATERGSLLSTNNVFGSVNIYFLPLQSGFNGGGRATFPSNPLPDHGIQIRNDNALNTSTLPHEMGHYFNLYHTQEKTFGYECPDGSNSATAGDLKSDTPADPVGRLCSSKACVTGCTYDESDPQREPVDCDNICNDCDVPYAPLENNFMSYFPKLCRTSLTPLQQAEFCSQVLESRPELVTGTGALPDFYIRDCDDPSDDGSLPIPCANGRWWVPGETYVQNDDDPEPDKIKPGMRNRLRTVVRNRGGNGSSPSDLDCEVYAYYQPGAGGLVWPPDNHASWRIVDQLGDEPLPGFDNQSISHAVPTESEDPNGTEYEWKWLVPDNVAENVGHWCIAFVIHPFAEQSFPIDQQTIQGGAKDYNNIAQVNLHLLDALASKSGGNAADTTVFHTRLRAYNNTGNNAFIGAEIDTTTLPPGWSVNWFPSTPQAIPVDSFFPVDINIYPPDSAFHGDTAFVDFSVYDNANPSVSLGGVKIMVKIDNFQPAAVIDLKLHCDQSEPNCCPFWLEPICELDPFYVPLEWSVPTLDTMGLLEDTWFYYVARDTIPNLDVNDIFDSVAMDFTLIVPKFQYVATHDTCAVTYYYAVFAVDGANNISGRSNEISFTVPCGFLCVGFRGNINGDLNDVIDISDLTYLVAYMFGGGSAPPSLVESDVNGDGGQDISDLTYLVSYMFGGGPQPVSCTNE